MIDKEQLELALNADEKKYFKGEIPQGVMVGNNLRLRKLPTSYTFIDDTTYVSELKQFKTFDEAFKYLNSINNGQ